MSIRVKTICSFCGKRMNYGKEYCPNCGQLVPQKYDKKAKEEGTKVVLIITAVCVLIALLVAF